MRAVVSNLVLAVAVALVGCNAAPATTATADANAKQHPAPTPEKPVMIGVLDRSAVEKIPHWNAPDAIDVEAAKKLAAVAPGAEVVAVIGTWCGDSRREMPRLWKALDAAGSVPFTLSVVGVDRDKKAEGTDVDKLDIRYVPTFIVKRDGKEVGRIIESAPRGVEKDLLSLLDGSRTGIMTGRTDIK